MVKSPIPGVVGRGMLLAARVQTALWDRAIVRAEAEQEKALAEIVRHAKDTVFGREHGFEGIKCHADFAARVPVGDYDSFEPYINRMRGGESNLLVPEFVRYYGNSSGSSTQGRSKFLPITDRQIAHQRRAGADCLMRALLKLGERDFPAGFTLGLFPSTVMRTEGPVFVTSNPALMVTQMPSISRPVYLPDEECRTMTDYNQKLARIAEKYFNHDVRAVTGTTCWFTLMFEKLLAEAKRRGSSAKTVREIWPNLRLLLGGGVSADPYLPVIRGLLGREDFLLVDTYNATEGGVYGASDHTGERGMLMLPHRGTYFEFVRLEDHEKKTPRRFSLAEVELGRNYVIVVTTVSGLYAYKLGDIVRFPQKNRIEFVGRLSGCLSVTQELTTHVEIERAVAHALSKIPCTTVDFGASADIGAKSRYLLFVEFAPGKSPPDLEAFASAFDEGLCLENRVYREHRHNDVAILPPRVLPLREGGARRYLEEVTGGNMQGKFPRIIDPSRKAAVMSQTS